MKGTGTQTDPYILQTADDLYAMATLGGAGVYCRLGADIDFDDTPYAENFVPIPVNWSSFDGGGHKIRNINASEPNNLVNAFTVMVSGNITISELMLENLIIQGSVVNLFKAVSGVNASIKLSGCTLILKVNHTSSSIVTGANCVLHGANLTVSTDLCVISLWATYRCGYALFNGGTMKRTQIVVDVVNHNAGSLTASETSMFRGVSAIDSWLAGKIHCDASGTNNIFSMADWQSVFTNCYQAVEMIGVAKVLWSNTFASTCFYDNDLMAGAVYDSHEGKSSIFYGLTTAQCKDLEYLKSIGFVCEGGGDEV